MKKNLMSVIILALVVVNLVLTGIMMFTIVPQTKNANKMIEAVCAAIDLELSSGAGSGVSNLPIDQIATYPLNAGETLTINLAKGEDGKTHYAVTAIALSLNNKSEGFEKYGATGLAEKEPIIQGNILEVFRKYTIEELNDEKGLQKLKTEILKDLQQMFGADFIVGVNFPKMIME